MGARSSKSQSKTTPLTEEENIKMLVAKWGSCKVLQTLLRSSVALKRDGRDVAFLPLLVKMVRRFLIIFPHI